MTTWALVSTAAFVSASPNTQLIKVRLVMQPVASAVSSSAAWLYVQVPATFSPFAGILYFDVPAGWPFYPVLPGP
jgi:hypothetical protein